MIQNNVIFGFIKKMFSGLLSVYIVVPFSGSLPSKSKEPIKCVSLNNRQSSIVDINSYETLFYSFTVSVNKCGGSCNTIDDPYAGVCVPNNVKNMNAKVFNLMSGK